MLLNLASKLGGRPLRVLHEEREMAVFFNDAPPTFDDLADSSITEVGLLSLGSHVASSGDPGRATSLISTFCSGSSHM